MTRWSWAAPVAERRAPRGREPHRPWSDRASERTPPLRFGRYRLGARLGSALAPAGHPPHPQAAWEHTPAATLRDILALVRRRLWGHGAVPTSRSDPDVVVVPRATLAHLAQAVCS
jgi:hypothetical protein